MQGRLREKHLSVTIDTSCAHCDRPMQFGLDSDMVFRNQSMGAEPMVFMPQIDWDNFKEPNIIDAF